MKTISILRLTLVAITCIAATRVVYHPLISHIPGGLSTEQESPAGIDDPDARSKFECIQLRDPATGRIPENMRQRELAFARTMRVHIATSPNGNAPAIAAITWQQRGPGNVGGRTRALALDVNSEAVMISGGVTGGMWRSVDSGKTWSRTSALDEMPSVTCVAQDVRPGKTNIWYYGTGEYRTNIQRFGNVLYYGNGIYKSLDSGKHWSHLPSTTGSTNDQTFQPFNYVNKIVVDPTTIQSDIVYAAVYGGIMRSTNGGTTWSAVLGGNGNKSGYTTVEMTSTGTLYAALSTDGGTHGIWRSADGVQWTDITPKSLGDSIRGIVLSIAPSDERIVYVLGETPGNGLKLPSSYWTNEWYSVLRYTYNSGDGSGAGGSWSNRSKGLPPDNQITPGFAYNGLDSYAMVLGVSPDDPNTVFFGGTNLYRTTTGFLDTNENKWLGGYHADFSYSFGGGDLHSDLHAVVISRNSAALYAGTDGGVFRLKDPDVAVPLWTPLSNNYYTTQFYSTAIDHATPSSSIVIGGLQDNGSFATDTLKPTTPWTEFMGGDGGYSAIVDSGKEYVVSSQFANIYGFVKDNTGKPFSDTTVNMPTRKLCPDSWSQQDYRKYMFVNPLALDPVQSTIMYVPFGPYLWRNSNIIDTLTMDFWKQLTNSHTPDNSWITAVAVARSKPAHRAWLGTANGQVFTMDNVHQGEPTKVDVTGNSFPVGGYINCIAVDPTDGNTAMAVFSNYNVQSLFVTTNGGSTWTAVSGNLEQNPDGTGDGPSCRWAGVLHRGNATQWFVATSVGLFSTTTLSGMNTVWNLEGAQTIGNAMVSMIDVRQSDGFVSVATWGNGMFTATIPVIEVVTIPQLIAPPNDAVQISPLECAWSAVGGATGYQLQVATDSTFNNPAIDATAHDVRNPVVGLTSGTKYFWRVRAQLSGGNGAWSSIWNFTTKTNSAVSDEAILAKNFTMDQCAPNPADASTIVRYTMSQSGSVRLELYDLSGRLVRTVMSGEVAAGMHSQNVETSSLIPGTYFLRMRVNGMAMVREVVVRR